MTTRLGLCSGYSLLYGVHKPEEIIDRLAAFGVKTLSICDLNNFYGIHTILEAAKEKGIRPIIGTALTIGESSNPAVYCFVENREGFSRLCDLLTMRNKDIERFNPLPLLKENAKGLVLASYDEKALEYLAGNVQRLYAAITPINIKAVNCSKKLSIPMAFLDNSLFFDPEDFPVHKTLRAIKLLKTVGNLKPEDTADKNSILRTSRELHKRLVSWPEAVKGTKEIAGICTYDNLFDGWIFPAYGKEPEQELRKRVYAGAQKRYGQLGFKENKRIEYELGIIEQKGFAPYFLRMDDIIKMASRTCGRGSGAASIVSYCLEITNVDPIQHNLYFERFLNPARPDPPDIDVDFAWDERDDLIKAVIEKSGTEHCARVANHNIFRYKSALRETAKAYGFGDAEITAIERRLFRQDDKAISNEPLWQEIFSIAQKIEGLPRGLGMHCGGLVITPNPIRQYVPVEKSAEGYPLLVWEKEGTEAAGFVKIDLLGNRSLAVIRDALKNLEEQGICIDPYKWKPIEDKATIEALSHGNSMGVFYIESPAMRQLQKKTNAGDFEHIVIHSSIIRPAANKFINEYVRRLKGGTWEPLHPLLENILDETYGILCYQEDVSKTAVALAGFSDVDADNLRKIIAKKMGGAKLEIYQNQFFEGCRKNGVTEQVIQNIWAMMLSFDGYSFCKPHSASYAMVSFQSAYLRVHHPAEFMAAVLSNQGGFYRPHAYIAEARRMRLYIEGPDINKSQWKYYGKSTSTVVYNGILVAGFMAVKGLSASGVKTIIHEREQHGDFVSLEDFSSRVRLNRDDLIALCPAGVFDSIANGIPRYMQARKLLGANSSIGRKDNNGELFSPNVSPVIERKTKPVIAPGDNYVRKNEKELWDEFNALGFLRKNHPLSLWKNDVLAVKNRTKAIHLDKYIGRYVTMAGWQVTQKEVWTKDGLTMSFLSLEDETGLYETVVFPKVYDKYYNLLFDQIPLLVYGLVTDDNGAVSLEINRIEVLGKPQTRETASLRMKFTVYAPCQHIHSGDYS